MTVADGGCNDPILLCVPTELKFTPAVTGNRLTVTHRWILTEELN